MSPDSTPPRWKMEGLTREGVLAARLGGVLASIGQEGVLAVGGCEGVLAARGQEGVLTATGRDGVLAAGRREGVVLELEAG